jgi:hypothetical protein
MHPKRKWIKTNPCNGIEAFVESHEVEILNSNEVERLFLRLLMTKQVGIEFYLG